MKKGGVLLVSRRPLSDETKISGTDKTLIESLGVLYCHDKNLG